METKHTLFKNYRMTQYRGNEIPQDQLCESGIYAVAYKVDNANSSKQVTNWGIVSRKNGEARMCYNVTDFNVWEDVKGKTIDLDLHYFPATAMETYFCLMQHENDMQVVQLAEAHTMIMTAFEDIENLKASWWYKVAKFFGYVRI